MRRALLLFVWPAALAAALCGCAGTPAPGPLENLPPTDTGPVISEVGSPLERAKAHTDLAAAYYGSGNMAVALQEARLALAADSNYAPAYNMLGLVYMDLRENAQAQAAFERAIALAPGDPEANHNYAWFLCQTGREAQSLRYFLAAVRNPLYATPQKSYTLAGVCALRGNDERAALEYLTRALRLDPNWTPALLELAKLKYKRGELEEARTLITRYNRLVEPTAQSLWLALRIERKLGDTAAENEYARQLRRRFAGSQEQRALDQGQYE